MKTIAHAASLFLLGTLQQYDHIGFVTYGRTENFPRKLIRISIDTAFIFTDLVGSDVFVPKL